MWAAGQPASQPAPRLTSLFTTAFRYLAPRPFASDLLRALHNLFLFFFFNNNCRLPCCYEGTCFFTRTDPSDSGSLVSIWGVRHTPPCHRFDIRSLAPSCADGKGAMIEKQSDAVSPKVADVLDKVMSQDAGEQTVRHQESPQHLLPKSQLLQQHTSPPPPPPPPTTVVASDHRCHLAAAGDSLVHKTHLEMVTSAPAHDKDSGDNIHYLRSDRNDSMSSSDAEFDYNDDDVFVGRRQMSGSSGMGLGRCPNDFLARSHQVYFKGADGDFSDGEKEGAMLRDARLPHPYAMHCSQYFPETNGLMPGLTSQPDFIRAGFHGSRGSSENIYTYSQSRVAPPLGGPPSVKQERDRPSSLGSADGNHGNHNGSVSSTDIGHHNARYPPGYKNEAAVPEGSSAREPDVESMPLHPPAMKFPLTSNRLPPFSPMAGGFGGTGGGMILSPTSGLPQAPFLNRLAPGVQPSGVLNDSHLYFCHICEYSGPTKEEFDQHMVVHFGYRCPHCDYTSRTEGRLKRHIKDFHTDTENKQRAVPGRPKVYRCKQCDFSCTNKVEFWDHARTHIKEDKLLQCPTCPFVTEYRHHLEYHLRNHFGSKPYKCGKCNYSCVNRSMLNSHMKSHTNVYQYRCADCTYATKYCHSLKLHLRKHRHQPAAVLNSDGSLPQGIDAKMSGLTLVAKRGPPRGPRGLRKEKDNNVAPESMMSGLFPMRHPLHHTGGLPVLNGALMAAAGYWPLLPNTIHPPPPLIPVSALGSPGHPSHPMLPSMDRLDARHSLKSREILEREGSGAEREGTGDGFKCNLCNVISDTVEQLEFHLKKVHELTPKEGLCKPPTNNTLQPPPAALEDQATKLQARRMSAPPPSHPPTSTSLAVQADTMYRRSSISEASPCPRQLNGLASHSSEDVGVRVNSLPRNACDQSSPKTRSPPNDYNIFLKSQIPMAAEQGRDGPPQEDGADIIRQMTLKFGPLPPSSPPPSLQQQQQQQPPLAASLPPYMSSMTSIASPPSEPAAQKESPLDLTNKPKSASPPCPGSLSPPAVSTLEPAVHLKRGFVEHLVASSEENSCNIGEVHGSSPRKRSRKGKAYKLEALCLKLQEKQTSSSPYQSDSNESDPADIQALAAPSTPTPAPAAAVKNGGLEVAFKKEGVEGGSSLQDKPKEAEYDENSGFGAADDPPDGDEYEGLRQNLKTLNDDVGATHQRVAALEKFNLGNPPFSPPIPPVMSRPDASGSTPTSPTASACVYREEPERENTFLLNGIYHHRRKLVTPAMRRGAEVAWKILHDPVNGLPVEVKADEPITPISPPSTESPCGLSDNPTSSGRMSGNGAGNRAPLLPAVPQRLSTHAQTVQQGPTCTNEPRQKALQAVPAEKSYECSFCDISFRESVMHAVHMGFHGYQDPFKCNMCGQVCKDKFEFFLHIARTAHN